MTKSPMVKDDIWKNEALCHTFLSGVRGAIPLASEQIEVMLRIISKARPQLKSFLDLGFDILIPPNQRLWWENPRRERMMFELPQTTFSPNG